MRTQFYAEAVLPTTKARRVMKMGSFVAKLMRAQRLKDSGHAHALPPGVDVPVYPVDMLPGCPKEWVKGAGSYVCPVEPGWGLWFDWTDNDPLNTAVVASVKGMNPVTGRKIEGLALEKFAKKCPAHGTDFKGDDLFCEKCGFRWPPQNYVCHPNTLWLDGWKAPDGTVRQFFFTAEDERDIASAVIGKENTMPAFGFAFFEPKARREVTRHEYRNTGCFGIAGPVGAAGSKGLDDDGTLYGASVMWASDTAGVAPANLNPPGTGVTYKGGNHTDTQYLCSSNSSGESSVCSTGSGDLAAILRSKSKKGGKVLKSMGAEVKTSGQVIIPPSVLSFSLMPPSQPAQADDPGDKDVSVGAGARIQQSLVADPLSPSDWKDQPAAVIRLYFCFKKQFESIAAQGTADIDGSDEGFLKGLPVG
jgi:hypothetical protein